MMQRFFTWLSGEAPEDISGLYFTFGAPLGVGWAALLLLFVGVVSVLLYWPKIAGMPPRLRALASALRALSLVLALFMLLDPCLAGDRVEPGEQLVALLFDDSMSMQIAGANGKSRGQRLRGAYSDAGAAFEAALKKRYQIVRYRVGKDTQRIAGVQDLKFEQVETNLLSGVESVLAEFEGEALSAIVLFSDGVQQPGLPGSALGRLAGRGVPVFTVGVDVEEVWRDVSLDKFAYHRTNFDKSPVMVSARIHSTGLKGRKAVFEVLQGPRSSASAPLTLSDAAEGQEVRVQFIPEKRGWVEYRARIRLLDMGPVGDGREIAPPFKDSVSQNNEAPFAVDNREKRYKILYLGGRPTWEHKYLGRALEEDDELRLVSLVRISGGEKKFQYRGVRTSSANPLFDGFTDGLEDQPRYDEAVFVRRGVAHAGQHKGYPADAETLFPYDLVIWAAIEHDFFSLAQLETTRDFVQKRGGALLLMGGPRSFAEGGYGRTLIDGMLPIVLSAVDRNSRDATRSQQFFVKPTAEGLFTGILSFDSNPDRNREIWERMPPLAGVNAFPLTRPGASVLARVEARGTSFDEQTFYAFQHYGKGQCAVLAAGATWKWQMDVNQETPLYGRLWRQIVRSLVASVPKPIELRGKKDRYVLGESFTLSTVVRDKEFDARGGLRTTLTVTTPDKKEQFLPVDESIHETGLYTAEFAPEAPGLHLLNFEALNDKGEVVGTLEEALFVTVDQREFQQARYNPSALERIAEVSGGKHYALSRLDRIAEEIPWKTSDDASEIRIHLWNLPLLFALLVGMMTLEWFLRRRRGYA